MCVCLHEYGCVCEWWPFLKDLQLSNPHHAVWILVCLIAAERMAYACVSVRVLCVGFLISGKSLNPGLQGKNTHTHLGMLWNHIIVHQDVYKRTRSPSRTSPPVRRPQVCLRRSAALFDYTFRPRHIVTRTNTNPAAVCCSSQLRGEWKEFVNQSNTKPLGSKGGIFGYVNKDGNILDEILR